MESVIYAYAVIETSALHSIVYSILIDKGEIYEKGND